MVKADKKTKTGKVAKSKASNKDTKSKTSPKKAVKKTTAQAARSITAKKTQAEKHYQELFDGLDTSEAQPYSMSSTFSINDIIDHHMFGFGLVTSTIQPNKIEVTFKKGPKTLISVLKKPEYLTRKRGPVIPRKRGPQLKSDKSNDN